MAAETIDLIKSLSELGPNGLVLVVVILFYRMSQRFDGINQRISAISDEACRVPERNCPGAGCEQDFVKYEEKNEKRFTKLEESIVRLHDRIDKLRDAQPRSAN